MTWLQGRRQQEGVETTGEEHDSWLLI
jgi:hypothetical protein